MPWFALRPDQTEYEIAPGRRLASFRATIEVRVAPAPSLRPYCFVDTGAPFSVVSQTVAAALTPHLTWLPVPVGPVRSEERRVGKECRSRWSPGDVMTLTVR